MSDYSGPRIVLGSKSTGRQSVLRNAGIDFECMSADIDEKAVTVQGSDTDRSATDPTVLTVEIAKAKAEALLGRLKGQDRILITSDQVVHYNDKIREKPETAEECRAYLKSYESGPACTVAGVVVTNTKTGKQASGFDIAKQWFKPIPKDVVDKLIEKGDVMWCCGGFVVDDPLIMPFLDKREGEEDSIIGLPMRLTHQLIAEVSEE